MKKADIRKNLRALTDQECRALLEEIAVDCVQEGRKYVGSSEILETVCGTLRKKGLDD